MQQFYSIYLFLPFVLILYFTSSFVLNPMVLVFFLFRCRFICLVLVVLGLCWCMGFPLVMASGDCSIVRVCGFLIVVACCGARTLGSSGSVEPNSQALEHRLSSCGTWVWLLWDMWGSPGPGIEPVSPALAVGFSTTESPGKLLNTSGFSLFISLGL